MDEQKKTAQNRAEGEEVEPLVSQLKKLEGVDILTVPDGGRYFVRIKEIDEVESANWGDGPSTIIVINC